MLIMSSLVEPGTLASVLNAREGKFNQVHDPEGELTSEACFISECVTGCPVGSCRRGRVCVSVCVYV
jgi:hypothetical protein